MSNQETQIYAKLKKIIIILLIFNLFTKVYYSSIIPLFMGELYGLESWVISVVPIIFSIVSLVITILFVSTLTQLYRATSDKDINAARKIFLAVIIAGVLQFVLNYFSGMPVGTSDLYFVGFVYLPNIIVAIFHILGWVKLMGHFKHTLRSNNGKTGCLLIAISFIPGLISSVTHIVLVLQYGYPTYLSNYQRIAIISLFMGGIGLIGTVLKIIGLTLTIMALKPASPYEIAGARGTTYGAHQPQYTTGDPSYVGPQSQYTPGEPPLSPPRFCTACGSQVAPESAFCTRCGHNL